MSAADKDPDKHSADADPPLTVELLADLQAGLLDDATAARIRSRSAQTRRLSKSCAR